MKPAIGEEVGTKSWNKERKGAKVPYLKRKYFKSQGREAMGCE